MIGKDKYNIINWDEEEDTSTSKRNNAMKGRRNNEDLNFICLTCDGVFPYTDRVNDERANKTKTIPSSNIKVPIMCRKCFSKLK